MSCPSGISARLASSATACDSLVVAGTPTADNSIADILQEPLGRNLAAAPGAARRFIDLAGDRIELGALQVAPLRIGDLIVRGSAAHLALHQVGKGHALVGERVAVLAARAAAVTMLALQWARLVADVLSIGGQLGMPDRRR